MGDWLRRNEVHIGDVRELAGRLEPQSIQSIVTSPPYWNLRSYLDKDHADKGRELGSEETPAEFVANLVAVFAALRPALKDDGTLWLNLGDSYASGEVGRVDGGGPGRSLGQNQPPRSERRVKQSTGVPQKCLLGMPWRVAFALIDDGWILRSDVIWAKPAPMPESVTDRPTRSHEYLFLLTKRPTYFYDAAAIAEKATHAGVTVKTNGNADMDEGYDGHRTRDGFRRGVTVGATRNKRSVWTINSAQFAESHFATFPEALVRPCILAGTSAVGECGACGRAWRRVVERTPTVAASHHGSYFDRGKTGVNGQGRVQEGERYESRDTGQWRAQCRCDAPTRPQTVLDPFAGSCTTWQVAHELGRDFVGIDLDERAAQWGADRLAKLPVGMLPGLATA